MGRFWKILRFSRKLDFALALEIRFVFEVIRCQRSTHHVPIPIRFGQALCAKIPKPIWAQIDSTPIGMAENSRASDAGLIFALGSSLGLDLGLGALWSIKPRPRLLHPPALGLAWLSKSAWSQERRKPKRRQEWPG